MANSGEKLDELQLKKRARRRLVGAVAFASLAAVVLPMVMDENPPAANHDVDIRIPDPEQGQSSPLTAKPAAPAKAAAVDQVPPAAAAVAATAVAAAVPAALAEKATAPAKDATKEAAKEAAKDAAKEPAKSPGKDAAKESPKDAAKAAVKTAEVPKPPAKAAAAEAPKPAAKVAAVDAPKADAKRESPTDTKRAQAILDADAAPAAGGAHVILIGAFASPANVKNLQAKLSQLGVKTYTEALDSPQGRKTRLRAGPFAGKDGAEKALEKMKRIGISGVVAPKS